MHVKNLKNEMAEGIDIESAEIIKYSGSAVWDSFSVLCDTCFRTGRASEYWLYVCIKARAYVKTT